MASGAIAAYGFVVALLAISGRADLIAAGLDFDYPPVDNHPSQLAAHTVFVAGLAGSFLGGLGLASFYIVRDHIGAGNETAWRYTMTTLALTLAVSSLVSYATDATGNLSVNALVAILLGGPILVLRPAAAPATTDRPRSQHRRETVASTGNAEQDSLVFDPTAPRRKKRVADRIAR